MVIFCIIASLFILGKSGFGILSGLRAYVCAEGLWAKGQKEATYQLSQYIFTEEKAKYQSFLDSLKIPLGHSIVRLELEKSTPVYEIIFQGFVDGGTNPKDIPSMILLYEKFKYIEHINKAIEQWEIADSLIKELLIVGKETHSYIANNNMSKDQAVRSISQIDALQNRLNEAEVQFSFNISEAARWVANLFFFIMLFFSAIGSIVCLMMLRLISGIIFDLNNKNAQLEIQANREKTLRKELTESEIKFRSLADTSPLAIYMSQGIEQIAEYINPTFTKLFGYTIDEVPSAEHWWPLAYPDEKFRKQVASEWQKKVEHAIETNSEIEPMEVVVTCKDGSKKNISWGFIATGKQNWAFGLDLTERKQAEDALHENQIIFQSFLENSPVYIFFKDHEIRSLMLSRNYEQLLGMPLENIIGKTMDDLFPSELAKSMIEDDKRILHEGLITNVVEEFGGRTYETTKFPIFLDNKSNMLAGFTLDITDRKKAEAEKIKLHAQLRHTQKMDAIGTLSGGIAHDFNNILTAILGYAEMAKDDILDSSPAKYQIEGVLKAGNRAKELVKQILAFSRKAEQDRVPMQIDLLIKEVLNFLRAFIPTTIDIKLSIKPHCGNMLADPTQIHQVLMNLCTNAAQAMEEDGGVLSIDLSVVDMKVDDLGTNSNLRPGPYILLAVRDTGPGIEKEHLDQIFDPYFTTKEVGKGSGMGLAVVHGIVHSHEGLISVESSADRGTTFKLYFPKIEKEVEQLEVVDTSLLPVGKEKILIVDDEASIATLTQKRLEMLGYKTTAMTSSKDALELFRAESNDYALVITDQTMPNMTGEQLTKELLNIRSDIPIIMCTGYSSRIDENKANSIGIRAFLMKPVDNKELSRTVRKVLDSN